MPSKPEFFVQNDRLKLKIAKTSSNKSGRDPNSSRSRGKKSNRSQKVTNRRNIRSFNIKNNDDENDFDCHFMVHDTE